MRAVAGLAVHAALAALLAAVTALLLAVVVVPLVLGWVPLTVLSGSMEPTLPTGSQVVVEPLEDENAAGGLTTGDVVTFMPHPDDPTLVTHRIVGVAVDGEGRRSFTTRGDANAAPDADPVTATQLRGVVKYHVPRAGYAATFLDAEQKRGGIVLVAATLFGYALWQLVGGARDRGRRADGVVETVSPEDARTEPLPVVPAVRHGG